MASTRRIGAPAASWAGCARLRVGLAAADVDALHFRVAAHGLRVALHQHLALVHHGDALRDGKDAIDVVLHQQHGHVPGESLDQTGDAFALRRRQADQRLVEQQAARLGRQRHADLDEALPAVR